MALAAPAPDFLRPGSSTAQTPKLSYRSSSSSLAAPGYGTTTPFLRKDTGDVIAGIPSTNLLSPIGSWSKGPGSGDKGKRSHDSSPAPSSNRSKSSSRSPAPLAKKKSGFLAGLLTVKEPSMTALAQMEAQMKHRKPTSSGSKVNLAGMPGVSSAKLPADVPKVNAKWDGIPDAVKQRDKEIEKERRRSRSFKSVSSSARSHVSAPNGGRLNLVRPNSASTFNSFESSESSSASENSSMNSSRPIRAKSFSARPSSLRSFSGASLPDVSNFLPTDAPPPPPAIPQEYRIESLPPSAQCHQSSHDAPIELPAHTISPLPTPTDSSPSTPSSPTNAMPVTELDRFHFPWNDGPPPPIPARNAARLQTTEEPTIEPLRIRKSDRFLAGEAQSLNFSQEDLQHDSSLSPIIEVRSDDDEDLASSRRMESDLDQHPESSRQRLGLVATLRKDTEPPPWDDPTVLAEGRLKSRFSFLGRAQFDP
ncbi:MAG: hypothetical protein Q9160_005835 [Pyrenula sp. 1 TL-2023]